MSSKKKEEVGVLTASLKMAERFTLLGLLPQQATYGTLKLVEGLRDRLMPDEGEFEKLPGYQVHENGNTTWNAKAEKPKRYSFGGFELKLVVEKLQGLDKEEKLTLSHLPLWERFIIGKSEEQEQEQAA